MNDFFFSSNYIKFFFFLQRDTSTTLISLSLTTLIMLLPHIYTSVINYLPRLYIVFIRIICWDKHNSKPVDFGDESVGNDDDDDGDDDDYKEKTSELANTINWNPCGKINHVLLLY